MRRLTERTSEAQDALDVDVRAMTMPRRDDRDAMPLLPEALDDVLRQELVAPHGFGWIQVREDMKVRHGPS
jgi:hypothetical protein